MRRIGFMIVLTMTLILTGISTVAVSASSAAGNMHSKHSCMATMVTSKGALNLNETTFIKKIKTEGTGPVHVYSEYGAPKGIIEIVIEDLSEPSTIVVVTYEQMTLKITAKNPDKVKSIIAIGYHEPTVVTALAVPILITSESKLNDAGFSLGFDSPDTIGGYKNFCKDIEKVLGVRPSTVQYNYNSKENGIMKILIDEKTTLKFEEPMFDMDEEVLMKLIGNSYYTAGKKKVKYEKNAVGFNEVWWNSYFASNRGYKTGKYYFEVKINPTKTKGITGYTNCGIGTLDGEHGMADYTGAGQDGSYSYGAFSINGNYLFAGGPPEDFAFGPISCSSIRKGDVIGIAMDLDNHRVYFSRNGKWMNGNPLEPLEGRKIEEDRYYYALGNADCPEKKEPYGDVEIFNFGPKKFKYHIPEGYLAFGVQQP